VFSANWIGNNLRSGTKYPLETSSPGQNKEGRVNRRVCSGLKDRVIA
jgi:hypothetical protein